MIRKLLHMVGGGFVVSILLGSIIGTLPRGADIGTKGVADIFSNIGQEVLSVAEHRLAISLDDTVGTVALVADVLPKSGAILTGALLEASTNTVDAFVEAQDSFADALSGGIWDTFKAATVFVTVGHESSAFVAQSSILQTASLYDSVQQFFSRLFTSIPEPTVATTPVRPGVSSSPVPPAPIALPRQVLISRAEVLAAVEEMLQRGLPESVASQLRGPKGDTGASGVAGPQGYSVGSITQSSSGGSVGTIGGVTYFGAKSLTTETLESSGTATLGSLTVSGTATLNGALSAGVTSLSSLTVSGTTTLSNFTVTQLDVDGSGSVSGTFEAGYLKGDATRAELAYIGDATYKTVQHMQTVYHSTGWVSGGDVTNNGGGYVTVSAGTGLVRDSNNSLAVLAFFDWPASGSFALRDNETNYLYIDYHDGSPIVKNLSAEDTSDTHSRFLLAKIVRIGSTIYLNDQVKPQVGDHAGLMIREMMGTMPYANAGGAEIMSNMMNPLAFDITEGTWWNGLNRFTTPAFVGDENVFSYFYRNGSGGWTEVSDQTEIDVLHYDNNSGVLSTLSQGEYGVHWIYLATNGDVSVIYGSGSYTLNEAQNATEPSDVPLQLEQGAFIAGKLIVQKNGASLTDLDAVSMMQRRFPGSSIADHNSLLGLLGGATDEYYHFTGAEHARLASGSATLAAVGDCSSTTAQKLLYNSATGSFSCGVDQNTSGGGASNLYVREFRGGGYGGTPASLSFDPGKFDLVASGASDVTISLDWVNGPASRSAAQTITGDWVFSGSGLGLLVTSNASVSGNFEITGALQAGATRITGAASVSGSLEASSLRALGIGSDTALTINPLTAFSIAPGGGLTTITGRASVSSNFEVSGFASASKYFGAGLTTCTADAQKIQYDGSTGVFACATGALARAFDGNAFVTNLTHDFHYDAGAFTITASGVIDAFLQLDYANGPASRSAAQTISGAWNFTGGASVSSNAFEVGAGVFYVSPTTGRVGINTQNLSQALEVGGSASLSGNLYALGNVGIGTVSPDAKLRVNGSTSDNSLSAVAIYDSSGTQLFDIRNDGIAAIGAAANVYSTFAVNGQSRTGAQTLSTSGSSTTVTTTGGAFADVQHDARLTANGTSVWVVERIDNNTLLVNPAVDWSVGYSFTYTNPTLITANAGSEDVKGISWAEAGEQKWQMYTWGGEQSRWMYLWNYADKSDILTISETGRMAVNYPTTLTDQEDLTSTLGLYPQAFDAVYFYKNALGT